MAQPCRAQSNAIAVFWHRLDGTACYLRRCEGGWRLTIERESCTLREEIVDTARDALLLAGAWSTGEPALGRLAG